MFKINKGIENMMVPKIAIKKLSTTALSLIVAGIFSTHPTYGMDKNEEKKTSNIFRIRNIEDVKFVRKDIGKHVNNFFAPLLPKRLFMYMAKFHWKPESESNEPKGERAFKSKLRLVCSKWKDAIDSQENSKIWELTQIPYAELPYAEFLKYDPEEKNKILELYLGRTLTAIQIDPFFPLRVALLFKDEEKVASESELMKWCEKIEKNTCLWDEKTKELLE